MITKPTINLVYLVVNNLLNDNVLDLTGPFCEGTMSLLDETMAMAVASIPVIPTILTIKRSNVLIQLRSRTKAILKSAIIEAISCPVSIPPINLFACLRSKTRPKKPQNMSSDR